MSDLMDSSIQSEQLKTCKARLSVSGSDNQTDSPPSSDNVKAVLNLESDELDPAAILTADMALIRIPEPKAKTYNHLDEYARKSGAQQLGLLEKVNSSINIIGNDTTRSNVSDDDKLKFNKKTREEELKKTLVNTVRNRKKSEKTILTLMNSDVTGPLAFLFKCINQRIKVIIRRRKIIFHNHDQIAHLFGSLVAFDKHYNLIMSDVMEKVGLKQQNGDGDSENIVSDDLPKNKRRNLKTIFIRGSNVLSISLDSVGSNSADEISAHR